MSTPTTAELQQRVDKLQLNMTRFDDIVNGASGAVVQTDAGPVPTLRSVIDQMLASFPARSYPTAAAIAADLAPPANAVALDIATGDYYVKQGSSGTGSWVLVPTGLVQIALSEARLARQRSAAMQATVLKLPYSHSGWTTAVVWRNPETGALVIVGGRKSSGLQSDLTDKRPRTVRSPLLGWGYVSRDKLDIFDDGSGTWRIIGPPEAIGTPLPFEKPDARRALGLPSIVNGAIHTTTSRGTALLTQPPLGQAFREATRQPWGYSAILNRPSIGADTAVMISADGRVVAPEGSDILLHLLCNGQSLNEGSEGFDNLRIYQNTFPEDLLMVSSASWPTDVRLGVPRFNGKVEPEVPVSNVWRQASPGDLVGFEPLAARQHSTGTHGVTPGECLGVILSQRLTAALGRRVRVCVTVVGLGGASIRTLKKNPTSPLPASTAVPNRGQLWAELETAAVARVRALAESKGWVYWLPFMLWEQGQADGAYSGYSADFAQLLSDTAQLNALAGQQAPVRVVTSQFSSHEGLDVFPLEAFLSAHVSNLATCSGPHYWIAEAGGFSADNLHAKAYGYWLLAEMHARAIMAEFFGTGRRDPLRMTSAAWTTPGLVVRAQTNPEVGPLVIDTSRVSNRPEGGFGIRYRDSLTGPNGIVPSSVTVSGSEIVVTLPSTQSGSSPELTAGQVGYPNVSGSTDRSNLANAPRCSIRDSLDARSSLNQSVIVGNWMSHCKVAIS